MGWFNHQIAVAIIHTVFSCSWYPFRPCFLQRTAPYPLTKTAYWYEFGEFVWPCPQRVVAGWYTNQSFRKLRRSSHVGNLNIPGSTLQGTNRSHLGKRKIIFKMPFLGDMLVPWRVKGWFFFLVICQIAWEHQWAESSDDYTPRNLT